MAKSVTSFRRSYFDESLLRFLKEIDTPLSEKVRNLLGLNTPEALTELVSLTCHPRDYSSAEDFQHDYVVTNLLKKAKYLKTGIDTEAIAREGLCRSEQRNLATNQRFKAFSSDPRYAGTLASVFHTAARKIEMVLGEFDVDELLDECRWGPGSTTTVKYAVATSEEKFRASRGTTPHAFELFGPVFDRAFPLWSSTIRYWEFQSGNQVQYVDKNAKTKRTIAKEPDFNSWFQLGVGRMIRRRMKTYGIDLNTQRNNQSAARIGSITGRIATIDVKDASNTLAYGLVRHSVNHDTWFSVLDSLRSHYGTDGDSTFRWEMFSSMGNGFTFELETLIFWALSVASCEVAGLDPCVWVFGDDIACPSEVVPLLTSVLDYAGFELNSEKSFSEGNFRESCGVHYWDGIDCQPIYIKDVIATAPEAYRLANSVRRLAERLPAPRILCAASACYRRLVLGVPPALRFGVPLSAGDAGFWVHPSDQLVLQGMISPIVDLTPYHEFGWEGFYVRGLREKPRNLERDHVGVLLARIHGLRSTGCVWEDSLRDSQGIGKGNFTLLREPGKPVKADFWTRKWGAPAFSEGFF